MSHQGEEDVGYKTLTCGVTSCVTRFSLRGHLGEHYQTVHSRIMCEYDDWLLHNATRLIAKDHFAVHRCSSFV